MLASFFRGTQTVRDKCYVTQWGGGKGCPLSQKKNITKMCGSTLLALRGVGWGSNFQKKALRNTSKAPKKKD